MLKQNTRTLNNEGENKQQEVVQLAPFIKRYFETHGYKEYKDEQNRLIVETNHIKMVQVRHDNAEDKAFYIKLFKEYLSYLISTGSVDKRDEQDVDLIDCNAVFDEETSHKDYNNFPMFFVYDKQGECLGMAGFRAYEECEYEGKIYQAQEMSWRMPLLKQKNGLEKKRAEIMFLTTFFACKHNQRFSGHMFEHVKDVGFHFQDYVKNFTFCGKHNFTIFFTNTSTYYFITI